MTADGCSQHFLEFSHFNGGEGGVAKAKPEKKLLPALQDSNRGNQRRGVPPASDSNALALVGFGEQTAMPRAPPSS